MFSIRICSKKNKGCFERKNEILIKTYNFDMVYDNILQKCVPYKRNSGISACPFGKRLAFFWGKTFSLLMIVLLANPFFSSFNK